MAEEWNVEEFLRYRDFIMRMRRRLRASRESFGVPHLIPDEGASPTFLDFVLRTNNHRVTIRLRRDNVYLIGYQTENGDWLEFGRRGDPTLIPGSSVLHFRCSYDSMAAAAGYVDALTLATGAAGQRFHLQSETLVTSVSNLATTDNGRTRAHGLIVVSMMICEAIRFNPILEAVATGQSIFESWMLDLVHNWGTYSEELCHRDADPTYDLSIRNTDVRPPPEYRPVSTILQVVLLLGITRSYCYIPRRFRRMIRDDDDAQAYCFEGRPLVEVFSVRVDNIYNEDPGQLYGTIAVNDGLTQLIYNRPRSYAESLRPGQNVTITGPHRSIWAVGGFTIRFLLTDSDSWSPDDEVVNDRISWDAFDFHQRSWYDKPMSQQVKGKYGSATVNYAILRNASTALVTINLQEGGEDIVEVYGDVTANYSDWDNDPNTTSVLFSRPKQDYLEVRRWQNIPLLKSIVAVPLGSSLKITANLYDYDPVTADDKIAAGTVEFPADMSGESSKDMVGEDGNRVTVTVAWGEAIAPDGDRGYSLHKPHDEL